MNKRRFNMLIKDLELVQTEHRPLEMGFWSNSDEHNCHTAGCAVGWHCALHPRADLVMHTSRVEGYPRTYPVLRAKAKPDGIDANVSMKHVAYYFDIPYQDAQDLFLQSHNTANNIVAVLERIKKYVKNWGDRKYGDES